MNKIANATRKFLRNEEGATMVEYALLVALIAVVVIVAVKSIGTSANGVLTNAANNISGS
jgi:pilus assembly protein Flp/PilA